MSLLWSPCDHPAPPPPRIHTSSPNFWALSVCVRVCAAEWIEWFPRALACASCPPITSCLTQISTNPFAMWATCSLSLGFNRDQLAGASNLITLLVMAVLGRIVRKPGFGTDSQASAWVRLRMSVRKAITWGGKFSAIATRNCLLCVFARCRNNVWLEERYAASPVCSLSPYLLFPV